MRQGDIRIEGQQWSEFQLLRMPMEAIKPVCPAAYEDNLVEPRIQRGDETYKTGEIGRVRHVAISRISV
jgi:hypothetical protein